MLSNDSDLATLFSVPISRLTNAHYSRYLDSTSKPVDRLGLERVRANQSIQVFPKRGVLDRVCRGRLRAKRISGGLVREAAGHLQRMNRSVQWYSSPYEHTGNEHVGGMAAKS